jgi:aryl-alcohol dehydrogenase-like predicted oxidoreductase
MRFRNLGDSDIQVSTISLGSWLTYSGGVERDATAACTKAAFDAGITFFDTANIYGTGASETAWGEILKDYRRDSYILATKVYFPMSDSDSGLSAAQIAKQIDASLERLQTDYVDLYQCHRPDPSVAIEETMEALSEVVRSGKARAIGFSEWDPEQIRAGLAVPDTVKFVSSQPQYSALWRGPEREVFPVCAENGISQVVWSPLAEGVLTGKYKPGEPPPADSRAASESMSSFIKDRLDDRALSAVQELLPIADGLGISPAQMALAWVLRRPEVASAIIGASRPEQVFDNVKASDTDLDAATVDAIDAALADVAIIEPTPAPGFEPGVKHR